MALPNNKKDDQPKRQSLMGFLFNPEIGASIRPLGESVGMFVRLIAMVFAMQGLFPRNHPALTGDDRNQSPLTLGMVFQTAWNRLDFSREGLPKVLFFFAVIGCFVFSALFLLITIFSLLTSSAHAAASGMFDTPDKDCDTAYLWINYLFMGGTIDTTSCVGTIGAIKVPDSSALQKALYGALGFYSNGVLIIASVLLLYHLLSMVVETAHHGQAMGKRASQIWAPLRLVFALGLLVPVAASGLNTGQYIVVQVARWGSGLATQTWSTLMGGLTSSSSHTYKTPEIRGLESMVAGLIRIKACQIAFNAGIEDAGLSGPLYWLPGGNAYEIYDDGSASPGYGVKHKFTNMKHKIDLAEDVPCGYYVEADAPKPAGHPDLTAVLNDVSLWHQLALAKIMASGGAVEMTAKNVLLYHTGTNKLPEPGSINPATGKRWALKDVVAEYKDSFNSSAAGFPTRINSVLNTLNKSYASSQGWATAGAWFNSLARAIGLLNSGMDAPLPKTYPPNIITPGYSTRGVAELVGSKLGLIGGITNLNNATMVALKGFEKYDLAAGTLPDVGTTKGPTITDSTPLTISVFLGFVDWLGQYFGMWDPGDGLVYSFGGTSNPLAELVNMGYKHVEYGLHLIVIGGGGSIVANILGAFGSWVGVIGSIAGGLASIAMAIGALYVLTGFAIAFMLPLVPFIKFFFGVLTWFLTLFEAVVAMPLLALAHISPYGEGLPGDMARQGYFFLLSIFLRPVLMVFGLVAGFMLFFVAINFLNMTYMTAVLGTGAWGGDLAVVAKIFYSVIYVVLAYTCANTCFKTISHFPDHALAWINSRGPGIKDLGDQAMTSTATRLAAGYLGKEGVAALGSGMGNIGRSIGGAMNPSSAPLTEKTPGDVLKKQFGAPGGAGAQGLQLGSGNAANIPVSSAGDEKVAEAEKIVQETRGHDGMPELSGFGVNNDKSVPDYDLPAGYGGVQGSGGASRESESSSNSGVVSGTSVGTQSDGELRSSVAASKQAEGKTAANVTTAEKNAEEARSAAQEAQAAANNAKNNPNSKK